MKSSIAKTSGYPEELINLAKENGYKAANLKFLDQILLEFNAQEGDGIAIEVPKHISISNQAIINHLDKYAPLWKKYWQRFSALQGDAGESLNELAIVKLREIQEMIHIAFGEDNKFVVEGIDPNEKQMVRSTGDEDRVDVANPGGNESVPSDADSISSSIGAVIASYFSEKSMSQRLKSGENITAKPPLMPCLIQKLVGEAADSLIPSVSGVIYTDSAGNVRIQAAYGHGELVVNSKGNFDNIFVTKENVVHQYLGDKKIRLIPKFDAGNKKITLEEATNNDEFAKGQSLDEDVSMHLAKFANFVEDKYGMRMDIEFVFDPASKRINIVQARPIPEGKRKGIAPSALNEDFISKNKPQSTDGQIITPDVMSAKAISNKDEILICDTIDEALTRFLKDKNNKFKAVVINKTAPDTSHEAGFFASQAIPVIHADQYEEVKDWVEHLDGKVLIVDPQHAAIYNIDASQFQEALIEEGMFRSTLAPYVTPIERSFAEGPSRELPQIQATSLGNLIREAQTNPDATQKLFRFISDNIGISATKAYNQEEIDKDIKQLLTYPSTQEDFKSHRETLANLLHFVGSIKNEKEVASSTYEQLMITGAELYLSLKEIEANPQDAQLKKNYLDIHQKFKGLMTAGSKLGVLSTSLRQEIKAHDERESLKQEVINAGFDLSKVPEETFLNLAAHKNYLLNDADKQKWLSFCFSTCQRGDDAKILQTLVDDIVKLDLKEYWMNTNFLSAYNNDEGSTLAKLKEEYDQNIAASENILKASALIDRLEHQIEQWDEPKKFKTLFEKELKKNIAEINQLLRVDGDKKLAASLSAKELYRLVDVIDLSIKKLQNSHLYEDKEQQVKNFRAMLGEFMDLMKANLDVKDPFFEQRINKMQDFLRSERPKQSSELLPSRDFSVIKADFFQDSILGFDRGFTALPDKTLADLHTVIHQAFLGAIARNSARVNQDLMRALPEFVKTTDRDLSNSKVADFADYQGISQSKIDLLYINANYPYLNLHYKIPLRNHSGSLKLKYNLEDKKIQLDYSLFGDGAGRGSQKQGSQKQGRWKELEEYGFLLLEMFTDAKLIEHKADDNVLNLQLSITQDTTRLKELFGILNIISDATLDDNNSLAKEFINDGILHKMLKDKGLSEFIIASLRDGEGKLNFKVLSEVIKELKNPTAFAQKNQELAAFLRLMAMDDNGVINDNKLKEIKADFNDSELGFVELVYKYIDRFSDRSRDLLISTLMREANADNVLEILNFIIDKNFPIVNYDQDSLTNLIDLSIDKGELDKAVNVLKRVNDQHKLFELVSSLIDKGEFDRATHLLEGVTSEGTLIEIVKKFIDKGAFDRASHLLEGVTSEAMLMEIAEKFIDKAEFDRASHLLEGVTSKLMLIEIAKKFTDKGEFDRALKLAEKFTDQFSLIEIAEIFINKGHSNKAIQVLERIIDQKILNRMLTEVDQSTKAGKELARIISAKIPTMWQGVTGFFGQANKYLVQNDPLKILGGAAAAEILSPPSPSGNKIANPPALGALLSASGEYDSNSSSVAPPPVNVQLPDLSTQAALGVVLYKMGSEAYKSIKNYLNQDKPPIAVSAELMEINNEIHKRIVRLTKIPGLCDELAQVSSPESARLIDEFAKIAAESKALMEKYYKLKNPSEQDLAPLYKQARKLNKALQEKLKEATTTIPELMPKKAMPQVAQDQVREMNLPKGMVIPGAGQTSALPVGGNPLGRLPGNKR